MSLGTIKHWMVFAAMLTVFAHPVYAETISAFTHDTTLTRTLDAEDECPVELPSGKGFTDAEKWAWQQICKGKPAVMSKSYPNTEKSENGHCGAPKPEQADNWANQPSKRHTLSPRFIKLLTAHAPYTEVSAKPLVHFECAVVDGRIDLSNEEIKPELRFKNSLLKDGIDISDAHFHHGLLIEGSVVQGTVNGLNATVDGQLEVIDSDFTGTFMANNLNAGGDVFMREAEFKNLRLSGANIEKNLTVIGSTFTGTFTANNLNAGGDVFLVNTKFEDLSLYGAKIEEDLRVVVSIFEGVLTANNLKAGGNVLIEHTEFMQAELAGANIQKSLVIIYSNFTKRLTANNLKAGGDVLLGKTEFKNVRLHGANVQKTLLVIHSSFTGEFEANNLKAGGDVTFQEGTKFSSEVSLVNAKIEGKLRLGGTSFHDKLDLSHAQILESFILYRPQSGRELIPLWEDGSKLILHNAYTKALQAKMPDSWNINGKDGFASFDLTGFTYDRLNGMDIGIEDNIKDIIEWIEGSKILVITNEDKDYRPQPYRQLAKVLREKGATDQARDVDIARYNHYYSAQPFGLKKLGGWLKKPAGYGIKLWPTFGFFAAVWFLLVLWQTIMLSRHLFGRIAWRSRGERWYYCFAYSFENLVPVHFMKHSPYRERIDLKGKMRHRAFWFRLFGFIVVFIATILAVLTSLIGPE